MHSRIIKLSITFMLVLCCFVLTGAQPKQGTADAGEVFAEGTGFKNRVFDVKHRDPESLFRVLRLLGSGLRGASMSADRVFRTITVRDLPENMAAIEEALKRLDTPEPPRPEVELHIHVLIAGNAEGGSGGQLPAELKEVVGPLQSTLSFKNYSLLTSIIQRAKEQPYNAGFLQGAGSATLTLPTTTGSVTPQDFRYNFNANSLTLTANPAGATTVQLGGFKFEVDGGTYGSAAIRSDVGVREGEKVVVGTAGLKDKALILVLTVKLIK